MTDYITNDTDLTVVADAIRQRGGTTASLSYPSGFASAILAIPSGGGSEAVIEKDVNFYDYDGTCVYSYTAAEAAALASMPTNPTHTGLTAQGWNYTLNEMKASVTACGRCDVGQMYVTTNGNTEIDICLLDSVCLAPYLSLAVNGTVVVDWGDGSATTTITNASLTSRVSRQHTYSSIGNYTISISVSSGKFALYGTSTYSLLNANKTNQNANKPYSSSVRAVRLGTSVSLGQYALGGCFNLKYITIPSNLDMSGQYIFWQCYSLRHISVPPSVTQIKGYFALYCTSLETISLPPTVTTLNAEVFRYCYALNRVVLPTALTTIGNSTFEKASSLSSLNIPSGVTSIGNYFVTECYSLSSLTIPASVTSIGNYAFSTCSGMVEYHFLATTPPTLGTSAFSNIGVTLIYVPAASESAYEGATNWSTYSNYIVGE